MASYRSSRHRQCIGAVVEILMESTSELLHKAKEAGIDLLEAEILVYYLKAVGGDIDKAIVLVETKRVESSADMLRKAKKAGLDLVDAEVLVHYLKRAAGDMDKAIVLAEAESLGAYGEA